MFEFAILYFTKLDVWMVKVLKCMGSEEKLWRKGDRSSI